MEFLVDTKFLCAPTEAADCAGVLAAIGWTILNIGQCETPEGMRWFVAAMRKTPA